MTINVVVTLLGINNSSNLYLLSYCYEITRRKNADTTETLKKHSDGSTLPYSAPNLTTMYSEISDLLIHASENNITGPQSKSLLQQTLIQCGTCCYHIQTNLWNFLSTLNLVYILVYILNCSSRQLY